MRLKDVLKGKLTRAELEKLRGFDTIGDIAVIEIPIEIEKKQEIIAKTLLELLPYIKTVAKKKGGHTGVYRKQPLQILAGENRKTTIHREHGLEMALNIETCYFSPRLSTERLRIAKQVSPGEKVLVLFSGIAPYPLVIAKHSPAYRVSGIEANPSAHKYALENVKRNKLGHKITLIKGNAKNSAGLLQGEKFDRVVMPWPQQGYKFLNVALNLVKKKGVLHFYDFSPEKNYSGSRQKLLDACKKAKKQCKILRTTECGQVGIRQERICIDARII
jgi:tRNA (guanine37-N1)-methyltransferase